MRTLLVKLSDKHIRAIKRIADARGMSKSNLVRHAISQFIAGAAKDGDKSVSALDRAAHLVGIVKHSPRGLATDSRFLDHFGRELTSPHELASTHEPDALYGFRPFAKRGGTVTNKAINRLRGDDAY
jgi:Ribbon-helix-helix protein, copG family